MPGEYVIALNRDFVEGTDRPEKVRFCAEHWRRFQESAAMTVNGVPMVDDGHGRLKVPPGNIGRG
jgi:hypothetical protein